MTVTTRRFHFQQECVGKTQGVVLNVGSFNDPAGLKRRFGPRVENCDITPSFADVRPYAVDRMFDCTQAWPFADGEAEMVVLGDILEHLEPDGINACLAEARRVSKRLCVTVPKDDRKERGHTGDPYHVTVVAAGALRDALADAGWRVERWLTVDYKFTPEGYFVECS